MRKKISTLLLFLCLFILPSCGKKTEPLYKIGLNPTWQPLNFQQGQGALNTFLAALLIEIGQENDFDVELFNLPPRELLFTLDQKEVDAILTILPPTQQNQERYAFSDMILHLGPVLVTLQGSPIKELSDLEGRIISVSAFDRSVLIAQRVPDAIITQFTNPILALEALQNREVDGVLLNSLLAEQLVGSIFKEHLVIATPPLGEEAIRLVVLKGSHAPLLEALNQSITHLRDKELYRKFKRNFFLLPK